MIDFVLPQGDLMVAPTRLSWVEGVLTQLASPQFAQDFTQKVKAAAEDSDFWSPDMAWARPYKVEGGRLIVPVKGMLLNKFPYQFRGMATGYEYIEAAVQRGVEDAAVREIVLDIDSPGGTVAGLFDCADALYAMRGRKPIRAFADESAYSAAYAIASAADSISVARTGGVGSIGVISTHMEMSGRLEQMGVKVTLIYSGARKADGHPAIPLSAEAEAEMQARCDTFYGIFVASVARNRGLSEQAVRDTEAASYLAPQAIEAGLADAIGGLDSLSATADPSNNNGDEEMSKPDTSAVEQAVTPEALAEATAAATAAATTAGEAAGRESERARIAAIMGSEEAAKRPAAARQVAFDTDFDVEKAKGFLGALPVETKEETAEGTSSFEAAMNGGTHPEVGADAPTETTEPARHERIMSTVRQFGLAGFKAKE